MIKAVIFDMDGLIVDSEPIESESLEILLQKYGKTARYNSNGLIHKPGVNVGVFEKLKADYSLEDEIKVIRKQKRRIFTSLIKKGVEPKEGLKGLIDTLKEKKVKIALASNRNIKHVKLILSTMAIDLLFEVIIGPSPKRKHKPSPDIYLATAKKLKVKPEECLVLEDSETGVIAGKDAGMKVIAVPNSYTKDQDLFRADLIVNSLKDIKWSTISKL